MSDEINPTPKSAFAKLCAQIVMLRKQESLN